MPSLAIWIGQRLKEDYDLLQGEFGYGSEGSFFGPEIADLIAAVDMSACPCGIRGVLKSLKAKALDEGWEPNSQ